MFCSNGLLAMRDFLGAAAGLAGTASVGVLFCSKAAVASFLGATLVAAGAGVVFATCAGIGFAIGAGVGFAIGAGVGLATGVGLGFTTGVATDAGFGAGFFKGGA